MEKHTKSSTVRTLFLAAMVLCVWAAPGYPADQLPPTRPESPPGIPPDNPEGRSKAAPPDLPPPARDPGIVKQPETIPHPDSVVVPPVVDPGMAVNPEQPQGTNPNRPPAHNKPQDDPSSRR